MIEEIVNYFEFAGPVGTAGQPSAEQFADVADAGFHSVINLSMPDAHYAIPHEGSLVTADGLNYFHIPVPFDAPEAEHLSLFIKLMDSLGHDGIFVHCGANMRVSAFMYHYLQWNRGLNAEQATSPILRAWLPRMDPIWRRFLTLAQADFTSTKAS